MINNYLVKFYYIGKEKYHGSQRQIDKNTIEKSLIDALKKKNYISDTKSSQFKVASRTDRYVSARGATFSFKSNKRIILMEINTILPPEMGVWAFSIIPTNFSPRFNAIARHYKYIYPIPFLQLVNKFNFKLEHIKNACKDLEGKHDFKNFSKININEKINTVRNLDHVEVFELENYLIFDFVARSFLRQQIRRTIKVLMDIGIGKISYNRFLSFFETENRFDIEPAKAHGLILWDIKYDKAVKMGVDKKSKDRMERFFSNQLQKYRHKEKIFKLMLSNDNLV